MAAPFEDTLDAQNEMMPVRVITIPVSHLAMKNYCYIVADPMTYDALVVDPAFERETIESILRREGLTCRTLLLTHAHHDHIDLAAAFATAFRCRVAMSRVEVDYYGFRCPGLMPVEDRQPISFGQTGVVPILTPGHTAGSVCFRVANNLFTGDTLFAEGCGICIDRGSDPAAMYDSLQRLKCSIPLDASVYPGHSYGTPPGQQFGHLLENNVYFHFKRVEDFVAYRMRKGQTGWLRFR